MSANERADWAEIVDAPPQPVSFRSGALEALAESVESALIDRFGGDDVEVLLDSDPSTPWADRVRPRAEALQDGHRLAFNVLSQEYLDATSPGAAALSAASVADLLEFANTTGLTPVCVVGYGFLLGHPLGGESLLSPADTTLRWRRSLSWLRRDEALAEFASRLDLEVVGRLPASVAPCLMVVLSRGGEPNHAAKLPPAGRVGAAVAELPIGELSAAFDALLEPLKTRQFGFTLFEQLATRHPELGAQRLLSPLRTQQWEHWVAAGRIDRDVTRIARQWSEGAQGRYRHGTDVTLSVDYVVVRRLLEDYLGWFKEDGK